MLTGAEDSPSLRIRFTAVAVSAISGIGCTIVEQGRAPEL